MPVIFKLRTESFTEILKPYPDFLILTDISTKLTWLVSLLQSVSLECAKLPLTF